MYKFHNSYFVTFEFVVTFVFFYIFLFYMFCIFCIFCPEESVNQEFDESSHAYGDSCTVAPFSEDSVSCPGYGSIPAPLLAGLSALGQQKLLVWRQDLLRSPGDQAAARSTLGVTHVFGSISDAKPSGLRPLY